MSRDKSWKNIILSSGAPLEGSINSELNSIAGLQNLGKYSFERMNERGVLIEQSVDFHASTACPEHTLQVDFLIEVKFRQPNTKWLFMGSSFENPKNPNFSTLFVSLDALCGSRRLDYGFIDGHSHNYRLGRKHLELRPTSGGKFTKGNLDHGYHQLRFATATRLAQLLVAQTSYGESALTPLYILVPIIVTSADLGVYKVEVTEENIKNAAHLGDLIDEVEMIMVYEPPSREVGVHIRHLLDSTLSKSQKMRLTGRLQDAGYAGVEEYIFMIEKLYPTVFFLMRRRDFAKRVARLAEFLSQADAVCTPGELINRKGSSTGKMAVA